MKTLIRVARIAALKRLLALLAGKFVEVTITSPATTRVMVVAALEGLITERNVALVYVVPRNGTVRLDAERKKRGRSPRTTQAEPSECRVLPMVSNGSPVGTGHGKSGAQPGSPAIVQRSWAGCRLLALERA